MDDEEPFEDSAAYPALTSITPGQVCAAANIVLVLRHVTLLLRGHARVNLSCG